MEETKFLKMDEIQQGYDNNDMDIINGVISGGIKVVKEETQEIPQTEASPIVPTTNTSIEEIVTEVVDEKEEKIKQYEQEQARLKFYIEQTEKQKTQEQNLLKAEKEALLKQINEERIKREEMENRIKEGAKVEPQTEPSLFNDDEDADLVSGYAKNTRKMIDDLKIQISDITSSDPKYTQLDERIKKFEEVEAIRLAEQLEKEKQRKQQEVEQKVLNEVNTLQSKYNELQTERKFNEIAEDFTKFSQQLANYYNISNPKEVDKILMSYFDENKGKTIREETTKIGLTPPKEYDKFFKIAELVDMTRGIEYDPILEKFVTITNSFGEPVKYRSLEESYKVKNYYNEINNAKKETAKQIKDKLSRIQESPVRLTNSETASIEEGITKEQLGEIIQNAEQYVYDKNKYKLLERAYQAFGLPTPQYKGK